MSRKIINLMEYNLRYIYYNDIEGCEEMTCEEKFRKRLIKLRMQKNVSARDMSLSMGQSEGYINKIETGNSLPSMTGFFYICDYFQITPKEFFDYDINDPNQMRDLIKDLNSLNTKQIENISAIIKDMKK